MAGLTGPALGTVITSASTNQTVDLNKIAGTATSVNNGTADAGTLRVTLASNSTGQVALATGSNVIGHVISDTGSTTAVTQATGTNLHTVVDSGTITSVTSITNALPTGANVIGHVIVDTGSTTAVTQATGTNLHTVIDSGVITSITNSITVGTHAITIASGGVASGAIASGAIASGAVASGAFASGSIGSGAIASGAIASGAIASGAIAAGAIATGATSIAANEDDASANLDTGVKMLVIQQSTPADTAGTNGDYANPQMSGGKLWVGTDVKQIAGTAIVTGGVNGSQSVGGTVATNVAITANPLNLGAQAVSSENAAVTTARQVQLVADLVGKLIVLPYANPENFVSGTATATDTTSTSLIGAPATGLRNYITQITVWNASAANSYVKIQDGSGGTTLYVIPAPTLGGSVITFPTPLRQPTTATAIYFAANASMNAVFVSASGYKGV